MFALITLHDYIAIVELNFLINKSNDEIDEIYFV